MVIVMSALRIGVIKMKNKEKYAKEIVEIACDGHRIAVEISTGRPVPCNSMRCVNCLFDKGCTVYTKGECIKKWAESEYIEKSVINKRDRAFLDFLKGKYKYIARDGIGYLYVYSEKPDKCDAFWSRNMCEYFGFNNRIDVDFPMVKWSDKEPWLIEDLKKLEVVKNYE